MAGELVTFARKVQKRASEAIELAARVTPSTTALALTFDDVLQQAREDE